MSDKKESPKKSRQNRRQFGKMLGGLFGLSAFFRAGSAAARFGYFRPEIEVPPEFYFAQLMYGDDMSWNPYPSAARYLMKTLEDRTSIPASNNRVDLRPEDDKLFKHPFLYWTGTREFAPLSEKAVERLRLFLNYGGFLLVDDALCAPGVGFDKAFQRDLARIFPGEGLDKLPEKHTVYQSYYLLDRAVGRTVTRPYLTGIDRGERTVLIYSGNDLGGAWARDESGKGLHPVKPGGELQREKAIRLSVNLIMYAMCLNYKKDLIHVPFISERRKGN